MNDTISIKKVTRNNHDYPAIKFNNEEKISLSFVMEAVFGLIVAAIRPLNEEQKKLVLQSMRHNMLNMFDKSEEEVFDFFIKQCKMVNT